MDHFLTETRTALETKRLCWTEAVYATVAQIPAGWVLGYKDVAVLLGHPGRARHVGFALAAMTPHHTAPWWRVIRSDGTVAMQGDPERGPEQLRRLHAEGVSASAAGRVSMKRFRWDPWA